MRWVEGNKMPVNPDWLLTDSWLTPDWLLTNSWLTPDWLLIDYWLTSDWFLTDSQLTPKKTLDRLTLNPTAEICWRWHQVSIWRAVQISSSNSESFPNQLSEFGYHQTPDWLLTDSWHTSEWILTDKQQTSDRLTLNPTAEICLRWHQSQFGELPKSALQIWRAFQVSSPNLVTIRPLTDYFLTPDILLTDSWLTLNRLQMDSH